MGLLKSYVLSEMSKIRNILVKIHKAGGGESNPFKDSLVDKKAKNKEQSDFQLLTAQISDMRQTMETFDKALRHVTQTANSSSKSRSESYAMIREVRELVKMIDQE